MLETTASEDSSAGLAARLQQIKDCRLQHGTIRNYMGKLNTLKVYLRAHGREELIDSDNNIIVPLDSDTIHNMFAWLSKNTDLPKGRRGR